MKQALQLKIGQQLTMTPQLQQAIRLLQLSTLDLQQEIQEALENNPLLENGEDDQDHPEADQPQSIEATEHKAAEDKKNSDSDPETTDDHQPADDWNNDIPEDLSTDSSWEDTFQHGSAPGPASGELPADYSDTSEESLQDHLDWQLNLTPMSELDQLIASAVIDGIDNEGYLRSSTEEILEHFQQSEPELFAEVEVDEIEAVLRRIQQFDPPGVGARDLGECLAIQLRQLPEDTLLLKEAINVVTHYIHLLGSHDYKALMRKARLKEPQLQEIIRLIQTLNPQPGSSIAPITAEYVVPDVIVTKQKDVWQVALNPDTAPKLRINTDYASLIKRADSSADNTYLKNHLQEARWFIKSLLSRNDTLLKVAQEIVFRQEGFLEYGEEAMKPMVLHDIAEAVEMHESTISRVTTQKFMHTPRGIFELKYFFSSHVSTSDGGAASSTAIRALIKKLIAAENPAKPLSDNKIAQLLDEQGIKVARRTIAKYREAMNIAPSNERKRLI